MKIDFLLSDADRERFDAPEALVLDDEQLRDQPAGVLMRWERECGYSIERALVEIRTSTTPPAGAVAVLVWLARKQMGEAGGGYTDDGQPEPFAALAQLRTMRIGIRPHAEPAPADGGDANPPDGSPAPSSGS